jgi:hypothetical protein
MVNLSPLRCNAFPPTAITIRSCGTGVDEYPRRLLLLLELLLLPAGRLVTAATTERFVAGRSVFPCRTAKRMESIAQIYRYK